MGKVKDLTGQKFGRLTAKRLATDEEKERNKSSV